LTALTATAVPLHRVRAVRGLEPGERGVQLLADWAADTSPKRSIPLNWNVYALARGAAFYYLPDWVVTDIVDPNIYDLLDGNPFGTWAVSPDQSAGVLLLNVTANTPVAARDAAWSQIKTVAGTDDLESLAEEEFSAAFDVDLAFAAARAGDTICAALAMTTPDTVMGGAFVYFQLVVAKADLFDDATEEVFLPMLTNLITAGGSACDTDPDDDEDESEDCPSANND
jgi:hypothetical protein